MEKYSLLPHNTFGIQATARFFLEYHSTEELKQLIQSGKITQPYLHIGKGSNLLFTQDFNGTVLHSCIQGTEVINENEDMVDIRVGAGTVWDDFVCTCIENEWYGIENLSLIPGEVGAAAVQNIGAYGVEIKDWIKTIETVDISGEECVYPVEACEYAYRNSIFKKPEMQSRFITHVTFSLSKKPCYKLDYGTIRQELAEYPVIDLQTIREVIVNTRRRKLPDPEILGNAGSFFMNPILSRNQFEALKQRFPSIPHYELEDSTVKIPAGWLIEQCGWKGKCMGQAAVHDKQALVLVNLGNANGKDIVALSQAIQSSVRQKFNIEIQPEVIFI